MFWGRIGPGGLAGLQNRDGGASGDSGGFDSHTLPPPRALVRWLWLGSLLLLATSAREVVAQDTTSVSPSVIIIQQPPASTPPPVVVAQDTSRYGKAPVTPMGGFFRSLLLPGWGQAKTGRRLTAGLFLGFEGVALGMMLKSGTELRYLEAEGTDSLRIESKKQEQQDWLVLLAFNHLFAGLEAYVSAHLWDFPADVRMRAMPQGTGLGISMPIRLP